MNLIINLIINYDGIVLFKLVVRRIKYYVNLKKNLI